MANQPPTRRPWFRLASQALRESAPQPQPAPPPPGPPIRQLVMQPATVLPPQPQPTPVQPQPQAPQPQPPPPPPQPSVTPSQEESKKPAQPSGEPPKQPSTPLPPLKPIKTTPSPPPQSPKVKSSSPSPTYDSGDRTLKPSPEPEVKKTIPEAQPKSTTNNGKGEPHKNAHSSEPKLGTSQADTKAPPPPKGEAKKKDEGDMRMITIAGENMGAYMDLGPPYSLHSRKQQQQQQQKNNGSLPKQGQVSNSATEDGKSNDKNGAREAAAAKAKPMTSLVNSNVQSVNNSIIFNSSCSQRSPGVHIALTSHRNTKSKVNPPPQ